MKKIVTSILGASLLAGAVYAAGNQMPHGNMMDHSNMNGMTKKQIQHCNDMMKNITSKNDSWTPPRNILAEFYPERPL